LLAPLKSGGSVYDQVAQEAGDRDYLLELVGHLLREKYDGDVSVDDEANARDLESAPRAQCGSPGLLFTQEQEVIDWATRMLVNDRDRVVDMSSRH
jgi:hypothetical protein